MSEWQPIETAPKETTVLLVDKNDNLYVGYYIRRQSRWVSMPCEWRIYPTHWMPLPAPPKEEL